MTQEHIVKSYDEELTRLERSIRNMGVMATQQIDGAIKALVDRDPILAQRVVDGDKEIDNLETEIHEFTVRLLALRQPMARDLRQIVAALRIAPDLERIGDYAKNVAKRSIALDRMPPAKPIVTIPRMASIVQEMISDVLGAFDTGNVEKAREVWERDAVVDDIYDSLFRELLTYMMEDPRTISACTHLIFIAKNIERMGDLATNIAETIHFQVEGVALDEDRPKHDRASLTIVAPHNDENSD